MKSILNNTYKNLENMCAILEVAKMLQVMYLEKPCTAIKFNPYGVLVKCF